MITDEDIEAFTRGDCHILARELSRLADLPLCSFEEPGVPGEPDYHAFVRLPDGKLLDIEGVHTEDEFRQAWPALWSDTDEPLEIIETSFATICRAWGRTNREEMFPDSFNRARELAPHLLSLAGISVDRRRRWR